MCLFVFWIFNLKKLYDSILKSKYVQLCQQSQFAENDHVLNRHDFIFTTKYIYSMLMISITRNHKQYSI